MKLLRLSSTATVLTLGCMSSLTFGAEGLIKTLEIGASAPDFKLPGIDGRDHSLNDYAESRILMVVFTANHCKTAQAYEGRIMQLVKDYRARGVAIVAIAPNDPQAVSLSELVYSDLNDSFDELKIRAQERGFNFPYLYDGDSQRLKESHLWAVGRIQP